MANYFSLVNHQGRLFITPPRSEQDGLLLLIDLKDKNRPYQPVDVKFNLQGDAFLVADTRGQVTMFQMQANRYIVVCQSNKPGNVQYASFTSRAPQDQVMVILKERKTVETHSMNGKLIDKFQNTHNTEILGIQHNMVMMGHIASFSSDSCIIWSTAGAGTNSISKLRSLYSKDGNHFVSAKFTGDGHALVTLQKDGELQQFSLDPQQNIDSSPIQIPQDLKSSHFTCFEIGSSTLLASGSNLPYLLVKSLQTQESYLYRLPSGCRGLNHLHLLRDQNLVGFLSEGFFYLLDLSYSTAPEKLSVPVKLNIRIPHEQIKTFDVDQGMTTLVLGTNSGNIYVYDLPKALENERILSKKRLDMGVEEELVVNKLQKANFKEVKSFIKGEKPNQVFEYHVPINESIGDTESVQNVGMHQENFDKFLPSFLNKDEQTQPLPEGIMPIFTERSNGSAIMGGTQLNQPMMQRTSVMSTVQKPAFIQQNQSQAKLQPFQSTASIVSISHPTADKQEYLNAGLSTAFVGKGQARTSVLQSNQVSIMKTIQSSVMTTGRGGKLGGLPISGSVMTQYPVGSVMSQPAMIGSELFAIDENYEPDFKFSGSDKVQAQFNMQKVKSMLKQFGEYPDKYRFLTWKHLLGLPLNREAFQTLLRRGVHPAFKVLHRRFPITQNRLYNKLVRTLSGLGNWCPVFAADNVDHLPQMVFPFIKVIPNDDLLVFELILALIVHYQQTWYEGYPAEPLVVMTAMDQILELEDPKLLLHLRSNTFTPQVYAWPILNTLFTDVLPKEDWLRLFDHIFTYKEDPELIIFYCAAFLIANRTTLLNQVHTIDDLVAFQGRPSGVPFKKLNQLAHKMHQTHKSTIFTGTLTQALPFPAGSDSYPMFTRYPEQVAISQVRIREKIILEEEELGRKQQLLEELRIKTEQVLANEERIRKQQEAAAAAELERKRKLQQDQESMLQERIRLEEITRLAKLEHIRKIEDALEQALTRQEQLRQEEIKVAEEEFVQRQRQAKYEYEARLQDENIANMEFKANQRLLEMLQKQQSEEAIRKMKSEFDVRQREEQHRDRLLQERWRVEDQEQRLKSEVIRQTMQHQTQVMQQMAERAEIEQRLREQELEKELQLIRIEEQRRMRQLEEDQILRKQRFLEDMRARNEQDFTAEQERLWAQLHEEKERERARGEARLRGLEEERERIEQQLHWERQERERLEILEHQKRLETQSIIKRRQLEEQEAERQLIMQKQAEFEREQQYLREAEQAYAQQQMVEAKLKESDNLMSMLRRTENHINDIVDRGQNVLQERKQQRAASSGVPSQYVSTANISGVNQSNQMEQHSKKHAKEISDRLDLRINYQDKENVNSNLIYPPHAYQAQYVDKPFPLTAYPQHFVANNSSALYSRSIGDQDVDSSTSSALSGNEGEHSKDYEQSSLSSLSSHRKQQEGYDSMLIEKHRQVKQDFEVYKQSFGQYSGAQYQQMPGSHPGVTATTNVFAYQPTGMTYIGVPNHGILQAQTISSGGAPKYMDPANGMSLTSGGGMPFRPKQAKIVNDSEYLSSSSSSDDMGADQQKTTNNNDDDGTSLTSSLAMSGGALSHHMLGGTKPTQFSDNKQQHPNGNTQMNFTTSNQKNQSSFSSSSSSQVSQQQQRYDLPLTKKVY